jgi:phospholipase D1/2
MTQSTAMKTQFSQLTVWDVFLLDSDFEIERPRRYYRQGFNLLHTDTSNTLHPSSAKAPAEKVVDSDCISVIGSIRSKVSKIFHGKDEQRAPNANDPSGDDSSSASSISLPPRSRTPMLDPSINTNPLLESPRGEDREKEEEKRKKARPTDVSKHTFYVVNSQMRLKIFAHSEVCWFLSWVRG